MGAITLPYTFVAGQTPTQTQWNSNPTTIATLVNGQIDKANVDSSGSDGIVTMDEAQTVSGAKTFSGATTMTGTLTAGVDDTGVDVKFFGASAGAFSLWDESANKQIIQGATAAGPGSLTLATGELTNVDGGILGRIDFQAPLDSAGTDAILVGASIWAEADATFSSTVNTTDIVFAAAIGETAAAVMRMKKGSLSPNTTDGMSLGTTALNWSDLFLDSGAILDFDSGNVVITHSSGVINVSTGALQVGGVAVATGTAASLSGSTNNNLVTVTGANAMLGEANLNFDGSTLAVTGALTASGTITANAGVAIDVGTTGNRIDLDTDNDTSIRSSADDTVTLEAAGFDIITMAISEATSGKLTMNSTGNATPIIEFKSAAGSVGNMSLRWSQGSGDGSADNMGYLLEYEGASNAIHFRSTDIDGSATSGNIWRVVDGQTTVDANTTWDDNAYDYACDDCGWHHPHKHDVCPECGGNAKWHDDNALIYKATHDIDKRASLRQLEKLGVIDCNGTLDNGEKLEVFTRLQNAHMFTFSALSQLHKRIEELERKAA
jgi:RNA polymerase subunit RPABC4/transcription elongation factor Spt4